MMWTGRADEAGALGLLLDRTYADVAAAAARPRSLDREFLIGQFDLWDNHLLPAVAAGTAPPWTRRSAARGVAPARVRGRGRAPAVDGRSSRRSRARSGRVARSGAGQPSVAESG